MRQIFRHELQITNRQLITIRGVSLSVAPSRVSDDLIDMWSLSKNSNIPTTREIFVIGTGNPVPEEVSVSHFVGTVVQSTGLVWHVFERHL